jgi:hypothetical protein
MLHALQSHAIVRGDTGLGIRREAAALLSTHLEDVITLDQPAAGKNSAAAGSAPVR